MKIAHITFFLTATLLLCVVSDSRSFGQSKSQIVSEVMEFLTRRFSKEVADEGSEILARKVEAYMVQYGDDGLEALRKIGPRAIQIMEQSTNEGALAARLLAKYGDNAIWVVSNPARRSLAASVGDDAVEAMIKHGEIAEPIIQVAGKSGASALKVVSEQNGRRMAMMAEQGELTRLPQSKEMMEVVGKYGDKAMDFVWKNKGTLMLGTAATAFLLDPEPFIDGTKQLADVAAESAIKPLAKEIGARTNWTLALVSFAGCATFYMLLKSWMRRPRFRRT